MANNLEGLEVDESTLDVVEKCGQVGGESDITNPEGTIVNDGLGKKQSNNESVLTHEGAVDDFLAGENKDDHILMDNLENDEEDEEIAFKKDNYILESNELQEEEEEGEEKENGDLDQENGVEETDDKSLNKMHIMEDVREGCNVQPSSPGHAEQRTNKDIKLEEDKEVKDMDTNHVNDDVNSNSSSNNGKRKSDSEESPIKRLRTEIQENFVARDKLFSDFFELADCSTIEQIQTQTELILAQIRTLNEIAKEKEREWNNIIHLKKIKEELLLRIQRKKQIMLLNENSDCVLSESTQNENCDERLVVKSRHRSMLNRCNQNGLDVGMVDYRQGKRPVIDVQSLIADYRQRHPENVPRRGRRIRTDTKNHIVNMALGSGAHVKHNVNNHDDLGILLNSNNFGRMSQDSTGQDSFKDMLVQLAKLSQNERNELLQNAIKPPPPYPEVTVHPVPTAPSTTQSNSLLHGILTKSPQKSNSKSSFSPTLARLLTAPERAHSNHLTSTPTMSGTTLVHPSNMSISEILSSNKARNEITITPVGNYDSSSKIKDDEEVEDSADRLVIDEAGEPLDGRRSGDNNSDTGDEVPQCQGCNQKAAQFVCAGCGNQWYCSRDCQVSAWDEHSEICSG